MSRSRTGRRIAPWFVAVGLALALGGCAAGPGSASLSAAPTATSLTTPLPTAEPDGPPDALLGAEGGDPVAAQVGTYIWGNGGSDSPWLPGAPIAVGAGEPLTVTLDPKTAIESWTAIYVPTSADGPAGGLDLGAGATSPAFTAPGPGTWTVDLEIVFADGAGTAHYAWQLNVR